MITGEINQAGSPVIKVTLIGKRARTTIEGVLDTGFDGHICVPIAVAVPLGLELVNVVDSELADGTIVEDEPVFAGKVKWGDETVDVDVLLTKAPYALIGTAMLRGTEVNLNFSSGKVLIKTVTIIPGESQ